MSAEADFVYYVYVRVSSMYSVKRISFYVQM
jgi:hypothetical protein